MCQQGWALWSTYSNSPWNFAPVDEAYPQRSMPQAPVPSNPARRIGDDCGQFEQRGDYAFLFLIWNLNMRSIRSICQLVDSRSLNFVLRRKTTGRNTVIRNFASQRAGAAPTTAR